MQQPSQSTRRRFLKQVGLSGIGALALPQVLPSRACGAGGANNRLNIAMIGCGGRSRQLLPAILASGENVVALCDVDARQFAAEKKEAAAARARRRGGAKGPALRRLSPTAGGGKNRSTPW